MSWHCTGKGKGKTFLKLALKNAKNVFVEETEILAEEEKRKCKI